MSKLVTAEMIIVTIYWKCPDCGHINLNTISTIPVVEHTMENEVQIFYEETCSECHKVAKIGATDILD